MTTAHCPPSIRQMKEERGSRRSMWALVQEGSGGLYSMGRGEKKSSFQQQHNSCAVLSRSCCIVYKNIAVVYGRLTNWYHVSTGCFLTLGAHITIFLLLWESANIKEMWRRDLSGSVYEYSRIEMPG